MATRSHPETKEDLELIGQAAHGDEGAFTRLVSKYESVVYRFAFQVCRDEEKAAETLQDTFINVYRKLKQFDRKSRFTTWLYRIVANNCLMKRRRRKLDAASVSIDVPEGFRAIPLRDEEGDVIQTVPSWKETPLHTVMDGELRDQLDRAIKRLPMAYRIVFVLRDIEEKSAEETAQILKLSIPAVKSRLRRARMFLRERLNGYMKA
ncbi:MAG: sigma-70 family RNA polymerase sigma factor [Ignavibacteriales bacterium]|nr:sigma-70 family RNA polymerase sigma factor [Ignavibacteriales bacterium]